MDHNLRRVRGETEPGFAMELQLHVPGWVLRLWGYFMNSMNSFSAKGVIAPGAAVAGGGQQHVASGRRHMRVEDNQPSRVPLHAKKRRNQSPACSTRRAPSLAQRAPPGRH